MNCIAQHFANELNRFRPLSDEEVGMLANMRVSGSTSRKLWTQADDRKLQRLKRNMTAEQIAAEMQRTPWSVRSRIRALKRGGK